MEQIEASAAGLFQKHPIERVGIGFGGPVNSASGVVTKSHQVSGWESFPLARWCAESLGRQAVLGNDCDVSALAEARFGAGRGEKSVFYVTVGTGIGGGLIIDGRLFHGSSDVAGEVGHTTIDLNGRHCKCGNYGCLEAYASGTNIAERARERVANDGDSALLRMVGGKAERIMLTPSEKDTLSGTAATALPANPKGAVQLTAPDGKTATARFD